MTQEAHRSQDPASQIRKDESPPDLSTPRRNSPQGSHRVDFESLTESHALQPCWDMQLAGLSADALHVALELGVFAHLKDYIAPEQLALNSGLNPNNTALLLELLWSIAILERRDIAEGKMQYRLPSNLKPYLHASSPLNCADALLFRHQTLRHAGAQLAAQMRQEATHSAAINPITMQLGWAQAAKVQIAQEQRAVTVDAAKVILGQQPEFKLMRTMLDLGGGPGLVAIALSHLQPTLSGVVFEYPAVAEVAQENIERAGLSSRLHARSGDLVTDDFGDGYDLIWCSSVLHFVPDIPAMLSKLHAALTPTGMLICCHAEISDDLQHARPLLPYYLNMRMQGRHVLPAGQLASRLRQAGFASVAQIDQVRFPVTPVTVLIARRGVSTP